MSAAADPPGHGPALTGVGHGLAKVFGVKLNYRDPGVAFNDPVTRGESVLSVSDADTYIEHEPTSMEWILHNIPDGNDVVQYLSSLVPFVQWLPRYNLQWLIGDLVAGITVGAVVVPQGMAYAKLATLPIEFGLYSSFMGVLIYWVFATSKDITIGPVAVMSTVVGNILTRTSTTLPNVAPHYIASDLAIIAGAIVCALGLFRLGWLVEFISLTSITAFITGSAFYIAMGQIPSLLGIPNINSRAAGYQVVINTLKNLHNTQLDAALGLTSLLMLYLLKYGFQYATKKLPNRAKTFFFMSTLRTVFVILLYTLISWLSNRNIKGLHNNPTAKTPGFKKAHWAILGYVPRGFQDAGAPPINTEIIRGFAPELPVSVIVLLIEHISIAKSFGRINNYTINPSQELIAIGVTNLLGPFLGAYPATGSFSRTAIKSKAGVRTPLAGVITAIVVLLAIYALPAVFFYIPNAVLSAVIIHAVLDLIAPMNTIYQFWRISPIEVLIFLAGVFVTVFSSIENGVYTTICISAALLLYRVAKARGRFLGRVTVHSVLGDHMVDGQTTDGKSGPLVRSQARDSNNNSQYTRDVFLPIDHHDGSNPSIRVQQPYPGVFIYRFSEGFNYPNASHYLDYMVRQIFKATRRTDPHSYAKPGDRPWNQPGPKKGQEEVVDWSKPTLKAVIVDFSSVNNVDVTSIQYMVDVRNQLDRYAAPHKVEWHLASINNRWTKRALASAGFGYPVPSELNGEFHRWKPIFSVAEIGGDFSAANAAELRDNARYRKSQQLDIEGGSSDADAINPGLGRELSNTRAYSRAGKTDSRIAVLGGLNRPFFHVDLTGALRSAISSIETLEDRQRPAAQQPDQPFSEDRKDTGSDSSSK